METKTRNDWSKNETRSWILEKLGAKVISWEWKDTEGIVVVIKRVIEKGSLIIIEGLGDTELERAYWE